MDHDHSQLMCGREGLRLACNMLRGPALTVKSKHGLHSWFQVPCCAALVPPTRRSCPAAQLLRHACHTSCSRHGLCSMASLLSFCDTCWSRGTALGAALVSIMCAWSERWGTQWRGRWCHATASPLQLLYERPAQAWCLVQAHTCRPACARAAAVPAPPRCPVASPRCATYAKGKHRASAPGRRCEASTSPQRVHF